MVPLKGPVLCTIDFTDNSSVTSSYTVQRMCAKKKMEKKKKMLLKSPFVVFHTCGRANKNILSSLKQGAKYVTELFR